MAARPAKARMAKAATGPAQIGRNAPAVSSFVSRTAKSSISWGAGRILSMRPPIIEASMSTAGDRCQRIWRVGYTGAMPAERGPFLR